MMSNVFGSPSHIEANDPEGAQLREFKPVTKPSQQPILSEQTLFCVQSFANATCIPPDRIVGEALFYWWESEGPSIMAQLEKLRSK